MKKILFLLVFIILLTSAKCFSQYDPPSGYTTNYGLRMWSEGDRPGADSINQNLKDIDSDLHKLKLHIDSLLTAFQVSHNYPTGIIKNGRITGGMIMSNTIGFDNINPNIFYSPIEYHIGAGDVADGYTVGTIRSNNLGDTCIASNNIKQITANKILFNMPASPINIYVSSTDGGPTDQQLTIFPVTLNGNVYYVIAQWQQSEKK